MDIHVLKLVSGEDVIARLEIDDDEHITLKEAVKIIYLDNDVCMMPLNPFMEETNVKIKRHHVIYHGEASEPVQQIYINQFDQISQAPLNHLNIVDPDSEEE